MNVIFILCREEKNREILVLVVHKKYPPEQREKMPLKKQVVFLNKCNILFDSLLTYYQFLLPTTTGTYHYYILVNDRLKSSYKSVSLSWVRSRKRRWWRGQSVENRFSSFFRRFFYKASYYCYNCVSSSSKLESAQTCTSLPMPSQITYLYASAPMQLLQYLHTYIYFFYNNTISSPKQSGRGPLLDDHISL